MRRTALFAAILLSASLTGPVSGGEGRVRRVYEPVLNIIPPGSQGSINALEAAQFQATGARPNNFHNQLEMYDALATKAPGQVPEGDLTKYFKAADLGVKPEDVVRRYSPRPGVEILRDRFGVPHIYGTTDEDTYYGAGYAGTEDRMFLQDTLRHVGAARAAEFLGPSPANIAMDQAQLLDADYTPEEAAFQLTLIQRRFGAEGQRAVRGIDAFIAGINAATDAAIRDPRKLPVEYPALQIVPQPWTRADIVYIGSLVGGRFGLGGGREYANGVWLRRLQAKFGLRQGRRIFDDLRERNSPEAPTTIPGRFPYMDRGRVDPRAVALPDPDAPIAPGAGAVVGGAPIGLPIPPGAKDAYLEEVPALDGPFGPIKLDLRHSGMSNALLVGAKESATGHPLAVFGPQTGYFTPQLLTEVDLHGPNIAARGVSFAGTQLIVELGRGVDYAWSATSAGGDNTDQVFSPLCNIDGSRPTIDSVAYLDRGRCLPMYLRVHVQNAKPSAGGQGAPQQVRLQVMRTRHGIVRLRTTAGGRPVAVVNRRVTYGHELDSAIGFMRINDPNYTKGARSFMRAFDGVDYTFNWFYADSKDIAYFNSGRLPVRDPRVDPDLPYWADYEWQGWLPFEGHPRAINPAAGYIANWNNKPAPGFAANDGEYGYGSVYRSANLQRRIAAGIAGRLKMGRAELVSIMIDAATADLRGTDVLPVALDLIGDDPSTRTARSLLRKWAARGAHRVDRDRNGSYDEQAAVALADAWYPLLAKAVLRGTLGELVDKLPAGLDNHPSLGYGSAWNGVAWYGYVNKDLRSVLRRRVLGPYSRTYCGRGSAGACRAAVKESLDKAIASLADRQGPDPTKWVFNKLIDAIRSQTVGVVGSRMMDWQNRPTFQQVVAFTSPRRT